MNHGIIKKDRVLMPGATQPAAAIPAGKAAACAKSVRTLSSDHRVRAIEITCSCGEKTLVELDVEEKSSS